MEGILFLLRQVENRELTAEQCLVRLKQCYGGYEVYFPSVNRKKWQMIEEYLEAGLPVKTIARKVGTSLKHVYIVRRKINLLHKQGEKV